MKLIFPNSLYLVLILLLNEGLKHLYCENNRIENIKNRQMQIDETESEEKRYVRACYTLLLSNLILSYLILSYLI